jgi:ABC-type glutathione transport system ATPase component
VSPGPSGVGKTTLGLALVGLASWNGAHVSGAVHWRGQLRDPAGLAQLRGREIGYLPQEARPALNPYRTCGVQMLEGPRTGQGGRGRPSGPERLRLAELLSAVGLDAGVAPQYPHRLAGGMYQRVLLAASLAGGPSLLVADKPTASLDTLNRNRVWLSRIPSRT